MNETFWDKLVDTYTLHSSVLLKGFRLAFYRQIKPRDLRKQTQCFKGTDTEGFRCGSVSLKLYPLTMFTSAQIKVNAWGLECGERVETTHQASLSGTVPPNCCCIIGYATEGELLISAHLSTDAVSALRTVWALVRLWKQHSVQTRT